jgi:hypothetical protein
MGSKALRWKMEELLREEKLQVLRFICAFAWADLEIREEERALVNRFIEAIDLPKDCYQQVYSWLDHPPRPEEIDPYDIPTELRTAVLYAAEAMMVTDGDVDSRELELLQLLKSLFEEDSLPKSDDETEH